MGDHVSGFLPFLPFSLGMIARVSSDSNSRGTTMQFKTNESPETMNGEKHAWKQSIVLAASFLIIILFLFSTTGSSFAGPAVNGSSEEQLLPSAEEVVTELSGKLQLTEKQQTQIIPILKEFRHKAVQLLSGQQDKGYSIALKSSKGQLVALYKDSTRQLKDILSSKQLALYSEYMKGLLEQSNVKKAIHFSML